MKKIFAFFILCLGFYLVVFSSPVQAFVAPDAIEPPSKFSTFMADVKAKIEKAIEWVSNSKMGKFMGKGIKATKNAVKFAQNSYKAAVNVYNQGMDYVNDVKNSKEYRSAMVAKKIADKSSEIKKLQQEKSKNDDDADEKIKLAQEKYKADLQNLQKNAANYKFMAGADSDWNAAASDTNEQIESLQSQLDNEIAGYKEDADDKNDVIDEKIVKATKQLAKLSKELAEINDVSVKVNVNNPLEEIEKTRNEMFIPDGKPASVANKEAVLENRYKARREAIYKVYEKSLDYKFDSIKKKEDVEETVDVLNTLSGESERSGTHVEVLMRQAEILAVYTEFVIADLLQEASVANANLEDVSTSGKVSSLKLCNYTNTKSGIAAMKDKLSNAKSKASNLAGKVSSGVQKAKDVKNTAENKINDAKSKVQDVKEMGEGISEVVKQGKDVIGNAPSIGIEGMI